MRNVLIALSLSLSTAAVVVAQPAISSGQKWRYPVKSVSINDYTLGMSIRDAKQLAPVEHLGGEGFETKKDGITYYLGVTPKGRVYTIQSSQPLGRFAVDRPFIDDLKAKLISKYGMPQSEIGDLFQWELTENVERTSGQILPFTTMWMSASTLGMGAGSDISLEIRMLDFRILWEDEKSVNGVPRSEASKSIQF